ncbi:MAG TPA: hypothetical protein VHC90_20055, partial [Bryobacteraceae bacterium]|nr:hypothetical protein [Bryobacteraceae bacterium]
ADGYNVLTPSGGSVTIDLANNTKLNHELTLTGASVTVNAPISTGGTPAKGDKFYFRFIQDATGSRDPNALLTFPNSSGAFVAGVAGMIPFSATANTQTTVKFVYNGTKWAPELPGAATS